jgi:hypothetical protein
MKALNDHASISRRASGNEEEAVESYPPLTIFLLIFFIWIKNIFVLSK